MLILLVYLATLLRLLSGKLLNKGVMYLLLHPVAILLRLGSRNEQTQPPSLNRRQVKLSWINILKWEPTPLTTQWIRVAVERSLRCRFPSIFLTLQCILSWPLDLSTWLTSCLLWDLTYEGYLDGIFHKQMPPQLTIGFFCLAHITKHPTNLT